MINLAGNPDCDLIIHKELKEAGIKILDLGASRDAEVPASFLGSLNGWTLTRAWYYWVANADAGTIMPFLIADGLHQHYGKEVRVAGHCSCPAPREWFSKPWHIGVDLYHIDTQAGLNAFAIATIASMSYLAMMAKLGVPSIHPGVTYGAKEGE
jgi:hypothetical protein